MARILLLTVDIDLPDAPINGGVHRVRQLKRHLEHLGHEVVLSMPFEALADGKATNDELASAFPSDRPQDCVKSLNPDIVLCEQWHLASQLQQLGKPLWIDLHGSLLRENAFRHSGGSEGAARFDQEVRAKLRAFSSAAAITCAGGRQRLYFNGWRAVAGRDYDAVDVFLLPLSLEPSVHNRQSTGRSNSGSKFVFAGNLWPWIEFSSWLSVFFEVIADRPNDRVDFFIDDPLQHRDGMAVVSNSGGGAAFEQLLKEDRISVKPRLPHMEFLERLEEYDGVVDLFSWNAERELAVTTRTLEYLSLGLPVIYPEHAELAEDVAFLDRRLVLADFGQDSIRGAVEAIAELVERPEALISRCSAIMQKREEWAKNTCREVLDHLAAISEAESGHWQRRMISLANESVRSFYRVENERAILAEASAKRLERDLEEKTIAYDAQIREMTDAACERETKIVALEANSRQVREDLGRAKSDLLGRTEELAEVRNQIEMMRVSSDRQEADHSKTLSAMLTSHEEEREQLQIEFKTVSANHEEVVEQLQTELTRLRTSHAAWETGARVAQARPALSRRGIGRRVRWWALYLDYLLVRLYMSVWQRLRRRRIFPGM